MMLKLLLKNCRWSINNHKFKKKGRASRPSLSLTNKSKLSMKCKDNIKRDKSIYLFLVVD